ncbi:ABC transporter ATP-binding protein [Thermoactinomyces sp. DSM 45892]|uniref:ABC transporter ATP-binding protein n=1 Tax=Thermoactinomyces sp. DSM 45892 TaxID=1882753 RepID=UPI00089B409F|nr:ABC transporter ATP-binding protein [Thermoactinomyces sp. DSM 45892]SDZ26691.1 ATP-binding cassette, subfamily B, MsbA [Thermoactinomyces sp. DSM 45892]
MGSVRRYLQFVKPYRKQIVGTMGIGMIKFGIPLLLPLMLKYVIDHILLSGMVRQEQIQQLWWITLGAVLLFTVVRIPAEYYRQYFAQWTASRVLFDVRNQMYDHIQRLSLRYYNNQKVGQVISRVINDVEQTKEFVITGMMNVWLDFITLFIAVGMMVWIDPWMTLISLSVFPLYGFSVKYFYQNLRKYTRERSQALSELQGHLHERIQGIPVIRAFHLEEHEQVQFQKRNRHFLEKALTHTRWTAKTFASVNTITDLAPIIVIVVSAYYVIQGELTLGAMTAFYGYLGLIYSPVRRLVNASTTLTQAHASMDRVFEFLDESYDIVDRPDAYVVKEIQGKINFDGVAFSYEKDREPVLKDINLEMEAGQMIALVGPSGGGKSSIVSLIPRFFDVTKGSIKVDGIDVRDYTQESLRNQIGLVLQDNFLFSGTIAENIQMGRIEASESEVMEAAKAANAHDFITQLPQGYQTEIGERGVKLSGGQKQRLAIARVFLKDPRIIILDEATSALDLQSEALVQESLERLATNRTTIIVAHRLSTITHADQIIVIDNGEVVERGTHEQLLSHDGLYSELFHVQNVDILSNEKNKF